MCTQRVNLGIIVIKLNESYRYTYQSAPLSESTATYQLASEPGAYSEENCNIGL